MDPATLMRTVDIGFALMEHNLPLVGAIGRLGTHGELMTNGDATGRTHNPIPAIALVELRTFCRTVGGAIAVEHNNRISYLMHSVDRHLANGEYGIELTTGIGPSVDQIAAPIVVPKGCGVNHSLALNDAFWFCPLTCRVFSCYYENTQIRIAPIYIIGLVVLVIADRGSPDTIAVLGDVVALKGRQCINGVIDDFPID